MASITHDAQSFAIDGRRRWLVAGALDYARTPRALWPARIAAARQAGLNCVGVPVNWSLHEPAPGKFNFDGDLDLAEFVRQVGRAGMLCILRPGPFIGGGWDMGGMPAWLLGTPGVRLRAGAQAFLEASSRWIGAVMARVKDLQAAGRSGGPIALIQVEHEWFCGDDDGGQAYLGELGRFLRESGLVVPLINANNLYQSIEGEIDAWTGPGATHAILRQLRHVRPDAPRLVVDLDLGRADVWGAERTPAVLPEQAVHRLAQVLAAGAQFQVGPFHGGTTFGFCGGRLPGATGGFATSSNDHAAPLAEAGGRGALYGAVKRIATFASSFERLFAGLDPADHPVVADPSSLGATPKGAAVATSVVHARGGQGSVAFVFAPDTPPARGGRGERAVARVTLPDGSTLPVDLSGQPVVWCLLDALLVNRSTLDYGNLSAFTLLGSVFVCFGPPGAHGIMSINGSRFEAIVPDGDEPLVELHEGVTVVVASERQIDAAYVGEDAVYVGCAGLNQLGEPLPHEAFKVCVRVARDGSVTRVEMGAPVRTPRAPVCAGWSSADTLEYVAGDSDRYATIDGPEPLERLGAPYGYAWARVRIPSSSTKKAHAALFGCADRAHLYHDGKLLEVVGDGPLAGGASAGAAADRLVTLPLRKGESAFTILLDNLGRWSSGMGLGEPAGLYWHVYEVKPIRAGKPTIETAPPLAPLAFRSPLWGVHAGDRTDPRRITWSVSHRRKTPIFMVVRLPAAAQPAEVGACRGIVTLNGEPMHALGDGAAATRLFFDPERLSRGKNVFQLTMLGTQGQDDAALRAIGAGVSLYEGVACLTEKAEWAFAKWTAPPAGAFEPGDKGPQARPAGRPVWWRSSFDAKLAGFPLFFDATGLTKGQIFLNGRNLCRYFVATHDGKKVPPQERYYLPEPWLRDGEPNDLLIFDEHGAAPTKCRLVYDRMGPFGG